MAQRRGARVLTSSAIKTTSVVTSVSTAVGARGPDKKKAVAWRTFKERGAAVRRHGPQARTAETPELVDGVAALSQACDERFAEIRLLYETDKGLRVPNVIHSYIEGVTQGFCRRSALLPGRPQRATWCCTPGGWELRRRLTNPPLRQVCLEWAELKLWARLINGNGRRRERSMKVVTLKELKAA